MSAHPFPAPPRPATAAAAAMLALLIGAGPATAAAWMPQEPITTAGKASFVPSVGTDAAGATTVSWTALDIDAPLFARQMVQRYTALGRPLPAQPLPTLAGFGLPPRVATSPGGRAVVAALDDLFGSDPHLSVSWLADDGSLSAVQRLPLGGSLATLGGDDDVIATGELTPAVVVAEDGTVTASWVRDAPSGQPGDADIVIQQIRPDGSASAPSVLETPAGASGSRIAQAPDGTTWVAWTVPVDASSSELHVMRVAFAGSGPPSSVGESLDAVPGRGFSLRADERGAAIAWIDRENGEDVVRLAALQAQSGVLGPPVAVAVSPSLLAAPQVLPGADGATLVAWSTLDLDPGDLPVDEDAPLAYAVSAARVASDGGIAEQALTVGQATGETLPSAAVRLGRAEDGSALATYVHASPTAGLRLVGRTIDDADATPGPEQEIGRDVLGAAIPGGVAAAPYGGSVAFMTAGRDLSQPVPLPQIDVAHYDATPPAVELSLPSTVLAGDAVPIAATVRDRNPTTLRWDLGDGTTADAAETRHAFARPGSYAVTATVADAAGNVTVRSQAITVLPASVPAPPPSPRPAPARRIAPTPRISRVTRSGSRVQVVGRLTTRATGRVRVTYRVGVGKRARTLRAWAPIRKGVFRTTLRLRGAIAKSRSTRALVTVRYAGNAAVRSGSARLSVRLPAKAAVAKRR